MGPIDNETIFFPRKQIETIDFWSFGWRSPFDDVAHSVSKWTRKEKPENKMHIDPKFDSFDLMCKFVSK